MADYDVVEVKVLGYLRLWVRFGDGVEGTVCFKPSHLYGVFEPLKDTAIFAQARCADGFVSWPGDIDLAPDAMRRAIVEQGEWVLA